MNSATSFLSRPARWRIAVRALSGGIAVVVGLIAAAIASAADYPAKPIRIIVGFAPVGGADVVTRIIGQKLAEHVKQSVIVENRAGAGGSVGAAFVANSAPDGYTVLAVSSSYAVGQYLASEMALARRMIQEAGVQR